MSDAATDLISLLSDFEDLLGVCFLSAPFAEGLCGPGNLLAQILPALLNLPVGEPSSPLDSALSRFRENLARLGPTIRTNNQNNPELPWNHDDTLLDRWDGLHWLIRSRLPEDPASDTGVCLREAAASFDRVWRKANLGPDAASSVEDCSPAESVDPRLFATLREHLPPAWTPGWWMVWDVLCQWNKTAGPTAAETTPVLFAGMNQGRVMRLTVEALPGPTGLVTPCWWRLGLCAFDTRNPARALLAAVQRVIRGAAGGAQRRFRWYLDATTDDAWEFGLDGRSIEAPTAVATLAVLERCAELRQRPDGAGRSVPVLDRNAVVTGKVGNGGADPRDWRLEEVSQNTLAAKLAAAREHGLDVIGVPAGQRLDGFTLPPEAHSVATVSEAFELLQAVHRAFARYGEYVRSQFHYHEEETRAQP
jgi:hypothetical protein